MKGHISRRIPAVICAAFAAAAFPACSHLEADKEPAGTTATRERPVPRKIMQLGFGPDAVFAACVELACPEVTVKTLATSGQSPTLGVVRGEVTPNTAASPLARELPPVSELKPARLQSAPVDTQPPALVLYFPFGGAALSPADKAAIDELVPLASKAHKVTIASRTDNTGSEIANETVAFARADAVREYLRTKLPAADGVFLIDAQGSCCYIASNDTPEGRKQNRRVEIVLSFPEQLAQ